MYHGMRLRKLGKKSQHRLAMFANMAASLIQHERIETTLPKAKELRRVVEKLITKGKRGDLANRRRAMSELRDDASVAKLFGELAPRFKDRNGGYTRVLKTATTRMGDAAQTAFIEFVDYKLPASKSKEEKKEARKQVKADAKTQRKLRPGADKSHAKKAGKADARSSSMKSSGSRGS